MRSDFLQSPKGVMLLAVIVMAGLFLNLGRVPLFDEDEGAYAEVTREMLQSGDLLVPRLEGKPFFHKPPMIYWTQALSVQLLGLDEFALRLPSALASLAWAGLLFAFVRRYVGRRAAWLTPFFLVTALQTSIIAKAAIADALLNLFITLTMLALFAHFSTARRPYLWVAFGAMALGFLTKGPIAVAIPAVVGTLFFLIQGNFIRWLKMAFDPLGWVIFLVIALPWYIVLYASYGGSFVQELFLTQNISRFRNAMEGHSGPIFYYLPVIIIGLLPYTTLLFAACRNLKKHWSTDLGRYLMIWFGFVLVFFSVADTKLHHYVVYGYVPLLIFMAQSVDEIKRAWVFLAPMVLFTALIWMLPALAARAAPGISDEFARIVIAGAVKAFGTAHYIVVGLTLIAVLALGIWRRGDLTVKIVVAGILFSGLINGYLMPKMATVMQAPIKTAALLARERGYDVVMWQMNYPSFSVYYGRPVLRRAPRPGDIVITKASKLKGIKAYHILYEQHGIVLTRVIQFEEAHQQHS